MTLESYALKILSDHGCDCYTYGGKDAENIMQDLKEGYPNGMEFPYIDVANAILAISRPRPIVRAPYRMVYDGDSFIDGVDFDTLDVAKNDALDTLIQWQSEEVEHWSYDSDGIMQPTEDEIESWDMMIANCSVWVEQYDPNTDEYETVWEPSYEDEKSVGWVEWSEYEKMLKGEQQQ